MGTIKGVGRFYQQTFVDTYSKWATAKLYTTKTPYLYGMDSVGELVQSQPSSRSVARTSRCSSCSISLRLPRTLRI